MKKKTPIAQRREKLGLTQEGMAVLCGTVQSEISKTERFGDIPADIKRWAKHYEWAVKKFRAECEKLSWAGLPLWSYSVETPLEIETIRCAPKPEAESVLTPEYAGEVITRPTIDPVVIGMIAAKARRWRRA